MTTQHNERDGEGALVWTIGACIMLAVFLALGILGAAVLP